MKKTIIESLKEELITIIDDALKAAIASGELDNVDEYEINLEEPREKANGDYSTNIAMMLTRKLRKAPRMIADAIVKNIKVGGKISKCEVAGAGFINFYLDDSWLYPVVEAVEKEGADYGKSDMGKGQKYMVEFVSANPTGPMHMGNARGGALGDCLAELLSWAGYDVTREFYINDAGNQIEKFANSLNARYLQLHLGEDKVEFPEDGYQGGDIIEHAKEFTKINGDKYVNAPEQERKDALVAYALEINIAALKTDLEKYRINYDVWFRESELHNSGAVKEVIELFKKSGHTYELDGALWFKATDFGEEKDDVLVRANGIPTYFAADVAYHRNKIEQRGFDKSIDIWGADHYGHVARMKKALSAIGIDSDKLDVIIMQLVRLTQDGEIVRMSKRTGKAVTLSDLLEDTSVDAARFFFNMRQADSHMVFDLDLAVAQTSENPVYYVQYAHARMCSIISLLAEEGVCVKSASELDLSLLKEEQEKELLKKLCDLPEEIKSAALVYEPSRLTRYCIDLASLFHAFYNSCHVRQENRALMEARLKLVDTVRIVLKNVLSMLSIDAPERM
ncbi:MAG: arginine--tRNA ligase [Ruminococcaceae bacterium]|nr:arginine--tRNA ligase [Oscillospiraceae bacterium]